MKNKVIIPIFVILLLSAMIPFSFTKENIDLVFGWLPKSLLYWWILMVVNLLFVFFVAWDFVKSEKEDEE